MLSVLLTVLSVLKIIGIVLLCILGFILFLLLLVLFVPIRYRADALIPETDLEEGFDIEKIDASAKFSWLLFVIRGGISFPEDKAFTLRICGIKILPKKQKEGDEKPEKKKKKKGKEKEETLSPDSGKEESPGDENVSESASESGTEVAQAEGTEETQAGGDETSSEETQAASEGEEEDDDKSFLDVLWNIIDGIDNFLKTPLDVLEKLQYTISRVCDKIDMIKSTLENEIFKRAFALVKDKLIKILKMILPDKCKIDVMFGSGDPATTAEIMAAYSALYPVLVRKVKYRPDFERKVIYTDAHIKGHITLFTIVYSVAVCYFNKDVKKTIKRIKKILES
jgi:hypothetical protein